METEEQGDWENERDIEAEVARSFLMLNIGRKVRNRDYLVVVLSVSRRVEMSLYTSIEASLYSNALHYITNYYYPLLWVNRYYT